MFADPEFSGNSATLTPRSPKVKAMHAPARRADVGACIHARGGEPFSPAVASGCLVKRNAQTELIGEGK